MVKRTSLYRSFKTPVGNPNDPDGLFNHMLRYLEWLGTQNRAESGIYSAERYIRDFIAWCDLRGLERPQEITRPILERYQRHLFYQRKKNGEPLSFSSQRAKLVPVRSWFSWLSKKRHILYNPAADLELPKVRRRLPKSILSEEEVNRIMAQPDLTTAIGIRDRAILETLYSTGIRRMELIKLKLYELDRDRGTIFIDQGKGQKDRMIPIGERALHWIGRYLEEVRPSLIVDYNLHNLFLTREGEMISPNWVSMMVAQAIDKASIGKKGACHLFRHTMATHMLENGADIRYIQAMLGHAELSTTEIYTQVSIKTLKAIHDATHPARLKKEKKESGKTEEKPVNLEDQSY